jgi:hypothetical protein
MVPPKLCVTDLKADFGDNVQCEFAKLQSCSLQKNRDIVMSGGFGAVSKTILHDTATA